MLHMPVRRMPVMHLALCNCIVAALWFRCHRDAIAAMCTGCALSGRMSEPCGSRAVRPACSSSGTPSSAGRCWARAQQRWPASSLLTCSTGGPGDNEQARSGSFQWAERWLGPAGVYIGYRKHTEQHVCKHSGTCSTIHTQCIMGMTSTAG